MKKRDEEFVVVFGFFLVLKDGKCFWYLPQMVKMCQHVSITPPPLFMAVTAVVREIREAVGPVEVVFANGGVAHEGACDLRSLVHVVGRHIKKEVVCFFVVHVRDEGLLCSPSPMLYP